MVPVLSWIAKVSTTCGSRKHIMKTVDDTMYLMFFAIDYITSDGIWTTHSSQFHEWEMHSRMERSNARCAFRLDWSQCWPARMLSTCTPTAAHHYTMLVACRWKSISLRWHRKWGQGSVENVMPFMKRTLTAISCLLLSNELYRWIPVMIFEGWPPRSKVLCEFLPRTSCMSRAHN